MENPFSSRRFTRTTHYTAALTLVSIGLAACAAPTDGIDQPNASPPTRSFPIGSGGSALYSTAPLWPAASDGAHPIPVCFETGLDEVYNTGFNMATSSVANFPTIKSLIREAIEDSWGRVANIRLTNWGDCPSRNDAAMAGWVTIYWDASNITTLGYHTDTWTRMGLTYPASLATAAERSTFQGIVRHEFGHALGFAHELDRPDNDHAECPSSFSIPGTPYTINDPLSVMNFTYCAAANARGGILSPQDIAGVQQAYGPKPRGSIVGLNGRCVNVANASEASGASIIMYDCHDQANDTWSGSTASPTPFRARYANVDRFLSASLPLNAWGTFLTSEPGSLVHAQQWSFDAVEWRGAGDLCVTYDWAPYPGSGQNLKMEECSASTPKWDFLPDQRIRLSGTNYCANVLGAGNATGTHLGLWPCSSTPAPNEQFLQTAIGELSYAGMCLNVWGGHAVQGAEVRLWSCGGPELNSKFHITGNIRTAGQCMDIYGGISENHSFVDAYPCQTGAKNQVWDYHW